MGNKADRRSRLAAEPSEATLNRRSARQSRVPQGWAAAPKNEVVEVSLLLSVSETGT